MYNLLKDYNGIVYGVKTHKNRFDYAIPFDPANTDAVEFAKWLKEGNKPEPAEEGGVVTDEWIAQTIALLLPNG